jgi:hypothetical protein
MSMCAVNSLFDIHRCNALSCACAKHKDDGTLMHIDTLFWNRCAGSISEY